jgi:mRNA interferase RelE/StbE
MTGYRLEIRAGAAEAIRRLPPKIKHAVRAALDSLAADPSLGEPLRRELEGQLKFRVRRYRIIYSLDRSRRVLNVLAVGHRRTVYEEFAENLRSQDQSR